MRLTRELSTSGLGLRAVVFVAPVLALLGTDSTQRAPRPWLVVLVLVLAAGFAVLPESPFGSATLGTVILWWGWTARDHLPFAAVPVAWLLLVAHVAALLVSYGPRALPVGGPLLRRWLLRTVLVGVLPPALWLAARALSARFELGGVWVVGLVAAVVVCALAALSLSDAVRPSP